MQNVTFLYGFFFSDYFLVMHGKKLFKTHFNDLMNVDKNHIPVQ